VGSGFANLADMTIGDNLGLPIVTPINAGGVLDQANRTIAYSAVGLPSGFAINASTGMISGSFDASPTVSFVVTVTASNGARSIAKTFTLTIRDDG